MLSSCYSESTGVYEPKEVPLQQIVKATETIEEFFNRYTRYLTEGDIEGLANI